MHPDRMVASFVYPPTQYVGTAVQLAHLVERRLFDAILPGNHANFGLQTMLLLLLRLFTNTKDHSPVRQKQTTS